MQKILKLMIVEDEYLIALDLQMQLRRLGYEVCELAASGEDALRIAQQEGPELVLMDLNLAGSMDGLAAGQELAARYGIPVAFISGYADQDTLAQIGRFSPLPCMFKPVDGREIHAVIRTYLDGGD
ncbi:MAG: response regulator [Chloroflexota bacterium]